MTDTLYWLVRLVAALIIVLWALRVPTLGASVLRRVESQVYLFARHQGFAVVAVAAFTIATNAAIGLVRGIPQPWIGDEFSHLLAADTFASGRLSNPTHPMWMHFETFQINQRPTYVSKYPPAQGMVLAVGEVLSGQPVAGVWLSAGLACGAICWMLQGWFRPGVALVGALLAVSKIGVTTYWSHTYWGGMVAALGGALVFGALKRVLLRPRISTSVVLGVGLAILANSRPYEGLLASIPVFIVLIHRAFRCGRSERVPFVRHVAIPVCGIGFLTLLWMGYYNFRQTGNALITAYQVYTDTYEMRPIFAWERLREPPVYHDSIMRAVYTMNVSNVADYVRRSQAFLPKLPDRVLTLWGFYCGAVFTILLLIAIVCMRSYTWLAFASVSAVVGGLLLGSHWINPHYAAPMTGPFFIVLTYGWSRLRVFQFQRRPTGLFLARTTVIICVALLAVRTLAACVATKPKMQYAPPVAWLIPSLTAWTPVPPWPSQRAAIESQLERFGGTHLIVVRYARTHSPEQEWVYNQADIDHAPVVWAREMDPEQNRKLIDYFRARHIWLLEPDQRFPELVPYPPLAPDPATASSYDSGRKP